MTTLTGKKIANTYKDLLQVSNSNSGIDATLRNVEDGEGTSSPLQISNEVHFRLVAKLLQQLYQPLITLQT